jgi:hypothetical protein
METLNILLFLVNFLAPPPPLIKIALEKDAYLGLTQKLSQTRYLLRAALGATTGMPHCFGLGEPPHGTVLRNALTPNSPTFANYATSHKVLPDAPIHHGYPVRSIHPV